MCRFEGNKWLVIGHKNSSENGHLRQQFQNMGDINYMDGEFTSLPIFRYGFVMTVPRRRIGNRGPTLRRSQCICRLLRNVILKYINASVERTCSTTSWPYLTTLPTASPMQERYAWNGPVFRCPAGLMETLLRRLKTLARSAARGRELAALLDPDTPVSLA